MQIGHFLSKDGKQSLQEMVQPQRTVMEINSHNVGRLYVVRKRSVVAGQEGEGERCLLLLYTCRFVHTGCRGRHVFSVNPEVTHQVLTN